MRDFKTLKVWQNAHRLALAVYEATRGSPAEERFGLAGQMRRAAAPIPANIAEGCGRSGDAELARFLHIAMGSESGLEYHLLLSRDPGIFTDGMYELLARELNEVKRMLDGFIQKLKSDSRHSVANANR